MEDNQIIGDKQGTYCGEDIYCISPSKENNKQNQPKYDDITMKDNYKVENNKKDRV